MAALSNYLENELLDHSLGTGSFTAPSGVYIALFTSDPTDADSGTEVSTGSYARQLATWAVASGGASSNAGLEAFTASGANWGTITHIGLYDALTTGNLLYHGALSSSKVINDGESLLFQIGSIDISLA